MTPKEELAQIEAEVERLEARKREIYRASVAAPESEKVCKDFVAEMLGQESPWPTFKFPVEVQGISFEHQIQNDRDNAGRMVLVRLAKSNETHLGVYLGRFPLSMGASYNRETGVLASSLGMHNPTMWVPQLERLVYGCESWWRFIASEEDFKQITDQDIDNTWYVKAWKTRLSAPPPDPNPPL